MTGVIRSLLSVSGKIDKLIAEIDESDSIAAIAQFEIKKASIERKGSIDIVYFQRLMVNTNRFRFRLVTAYDSFSIGR